jgi:ribosomal protein S18
MKKFIRKKKKKINLKQNLIILSKKKKFNLKKNIFNDRIIIKKLLKKKKFHINYKNVKLLSFFINSFGSIKSRAFTGLFLHTHKKISSLIKRARSQKLIPFLIPARRFFN